MFTGIVQGKAQIHAIDKRENLHCLTISFPNNALKELTQGASIAINGTCLTVTQFTEHTACFDVMQESLNLTNLGDLKPNDFVNFERAARIGDEIGGHLLSGHIHTRVSISTIQKDTNQCTLWFNTPKAWLKYILPKGFVALNGCSLTVGEVNERGFCVHLIPETLAVTVFGNSLVDDIVNLEVDHQTQTIVDTIERLGLKPA